MTKDDLAAYQRTLVSLRSRLTGDVSQLTDEAFRAANSAAGGNLSTAPQHPADLGTDAFEQEFTLSLVKNQQQVLEEIDDALERARAGTFGCCEECHSTIAKSRLQALPYARYCVVCARELQ